MAFILQRHLRRSEHSPSCHIHAIECFVVSLGSTKIRKTSKQCAHSPCSVPPPLVRPSVVLWEGMVPYTRLLAKNSGPKRCILCFLTKLISTEKLRGFAKIFEHEIFAFSSSARSTLPGTLEVIRKFMLQFVLSKSCGQRIL